MHANVANVGHKVSFFPWSVEKPYFWRSSSCVSGAGWGRFGAVICLLYLWRLCLKLSHVFCSYFGSQIGFHETFTSSFLEGSNALFLLFITNTHTHTHTHMHANTQLFCPVLYSGGWCYVELSCLSCTEDLPCCKFRLFAHIFFVTSHRATLCVLSCSAAPYERNPPNVNHCAIWLLRLDYGCFD